MDIKSEVKEQTNWIEMIVGDQTYTLLKSVFGLLFRQTIFFLGSPLSFVTRPFNTIYIVGFFGVVYIGLLVSNVLFLLGKTLFFCGGFV